MLNFTPKGALVRALARDARKPEDLIVRNVAGCMVSRGPVSNTASLRALLLAILMVTGTLFASNVMAGHETTLPITLDHMIYHAISVVKAASRAFVVVYLPFGSYQGDSKKALRSSIRIMKESGAHAVKLEGGDEIIDSVQRILTAGIPVMGHLGLTPQSIYKFGTYTVRAKQEAEAEKLIEDAKLLQEAGCFAIVLEKIPAGLAKKVSNELKIPIIGIGAGNGVDGQVLVLLDMLGMTHEFNPRFLRRYLNLYEDINQAVKNYVDDVKKLDFPNENEEY